MNQEEPGCGWSASGTIEAMAQYQKLVRDNIPEILDAKGIAYEQHIATDEEYRAELITKLAEEVEEFSEAGAPEELADVLEVIAALRQLPEYHDVEELRKDKLARRGGFSSRIILKSEK